MSLTVEQFVTTGFGWGNAAPNSKKSYRRHVTQFEEFLQTHDKTAADGSVNEEDIARYLDHLKSKYAPNTVAVKIASVKSYFKWLKKIGKLTHIPTIRSQKTVIPERVHVEDGHIKSIMGLLHGDSSKSQRDRAMLSLIADCGFRTEEVVAINNEDIDFKEGTICGRNARQALSYLVDYARTKISENLTWNAETVDPNTVVKVPFFLNKHGQRISSRSFRRHLNHYREKLGLPVFSTRDLRHTWFEKQKAHSEAATIGTT